VRQAVNAALREHRALVVLAVTVATLLVLAIVILPQLLAGGEDTENDVRSTLLQGLAGLFLAAGLYFTAQTLRLNRQSAERTYRLERQGRKGEHVLDLRSVDLRQARFGKGADEGHFELANLAGAQRGRP
jgi:hypothetical protein